jgi:hypothetical protein
MVGILRLRSSCASHKRRSAQDDIILVFFACGYAGVTRMLMSTVVKERVRTPTEMKSTPVSA